MQFFISKRELAAGKLGAVEAHMQGRLRRAASRLGSALAFRNGQLVQGAVRATRLAIEKRLVSSAFLDYGFARPPAPPSGGPMPACGYALTVSDAKNFSLRHHLQR